MAISIWMAAVALAVILPAPAHAAGAGDNIRCETEKVTLDTAFPSGNVASCEASGSKRINVTLVPEDKPPINCSAWYAFRLTPRTPGKITLNLDYEACGHRYWPKTSSDGVNWDYLPKKFVKVEEVDGLKRARITVKLKNVPLFVSAQEIFPPSVYRAWLDQTAQSSDAEGWLLGKSAEGRDIPGLNIRTNGTEPLEQVVLIGRQHPPEVTGALAILPFVETLLADTPLAKRYRERFETIVVPMLNPDGVVRGHWRHSTGHVDLNRDWGPFTQPETKLMKALLDGIEKDLNKNLRLFVDFHSTKHDIFYTIPDDYQTTPPLFLKNWLDLLQQRTPDYEVNRDAGHNLGQPNSKNYVHKRYGVPTMTYEMGDETDRQLLRKIAIAAATAMMETLLGTEAPR
ncbi:M14-type cytosolic carboxypeptidase [Parasphingorhabdus sp.]|uniref:M14 family metallopeptidase n=1 Tax=Parasphingorhabdus sp. TaxID=2709688 RepID=UPI003A8F43EC